jgi:hypothetical protein
VQSGTATGASVGERVLVMRVRERITVAQDVVHVVLEGDSSGRFPRGSRARISIFCSPRPWSGKKEMERTATWVSRSIPANCLR